MLAVEVGDVVFQDPEKSLTSVELSRIHRPILSRPHYHTHSESAAALH